MKKNISSEIEVKKIYPWQKAFILMKMILIKKIYFILIMKIKLKMMLKRKNKKITIMIIYKMKI